MKISAAATLTAAALAVAACGGGAATETAAPEAPITEPTAISPKQEKFPPEVRSGFLDACTKRADKERCRCALDYLDKNATAEELAAAGLEAGDEKKTPKLLEKAVAKCA